MEILWKNQSSNFVIAQKWEPCVGIDKCISEIVSFFRYTQTKATTNSGELDPEESAIYLVKLEVNSRVNTAVKISKIRYSSLS